MELLSLQRRTAYYGYQFQGCSRMRITDIVGELKRSFLSVKFMVLWLDVSFTLKTNQWNQIIVIIVSLFLAIIPGVSMIEIDSHFIVVLECFIALKNSVKQLFRFNY